MDQDDPLGVLLTVICEPKAKKDSLKGALNAVCIPKKSSKSHLIKI